MKKIIAMLCMVLFLSLCSADTIVETYVTTDGNVSAYQQIDANGSVRNSQWVNSGGDVESHHGINANGSVEIWIDGANWTNLPDYVATHENDWDEDPIDKGHVVQMMRDCYEFRFEGKPIKSETEEFCFYLESYVAGLYNLHMHPEMQAEMAAGLAEVKTETHENLSDLEEQLDEGLGNLEGKTDELEFKTKYGYQTSLQWMKANERDVEEVAASLEEEKENRHESVEGLKGDIEEVNSSLSREGVRGGTVGLVTSAENVILGALVVMALLVAYLLYMNITAHRANIWKVKRRIALLSRTVSEAESGEVGFKILSGFMIVAIIAFLVAGLLTI